MNNFLFVSIRESDHLQKADVNLFCECYIGVLWSMLGEDNNIIFTKKVNISKVMIQTDISFSTSTSLPLRHRGS